MRCPGTRAFEFEIRPFHRDHADLHVDRELTDGRDGLTLGSIAYGNPLFDLFHDLKVDRTFVRLRDDEPNKIDTPARYRGPRHVRARSRVEFLGDGNGADVFMPLSAAVPSPSYPETVTAISWPPPRSIKERRKTVIRRAILRAGYRFQTELTIKHVQISLCRADNA
jgi:hypothetical protein